MRTGKPRARVTNSTVDFEFTDRTAGSFAYLLLEMSVGIAEGADTVIYANCDA